MKKIVCTVWIAALLGCANNAGNNNGNDTTVIKGNNESNLAGDTALFSDSTIRTNDSNR